MLDGESKKQNSRELLLSLRQALIIAVRAIERYLDIDSCIKTKRDK